ncbi:MAG: sulfite exporter TauE/SafE family protein [Candidatus Tectimicrobiota bacterium]
MVSVHNLPGWVRAGVLLMCAGVLGVRLPAVSAAPHTHTMPALHVHSGDMSTPEQSGTLATPAGFFALLGAGLLTGLSHCVGMCGPLVGAFAMRRRATGGELSTPLVLFQLGRLLTYGLLGAVVGSAGAVFASTVQAWQGLFAMSMGGLVLVAGAGLLGLIPLQHWLATLVPAQWLHTRVLACLDARHPLAPLGLGLANGVLPCGAVYTMALLAAMSANPWKGASLMLLFGFGTLPALLGLGFSAALLSVRLRYGLYRGAALLVCGVGVQLTLRGLALEGHIAHAAIGGLMLW